MYAHGCNISNGDRGIVDQACRLVTFMHKRKMQIRLVPPTPNKVMVRHNEIYGIPVIADHKILLLLLLHSILSTL